jgi:hypothetical protein
MPDPDRALCGFRMSALDAVVLALSAGATVGLCFLIGQKGLTIGLLVGHFFLFCNVIRVHRYLEATWAALFVANVAAWILLERFQDVSFSWWIVLGLQTPVTLLFLVLELRSARYHGIGCRKINPKLGEYLAKRKAGLAAGNRDLLDNQ